MRIQLTEIAHTFGRQTRAYAEYRVFTSLVRSSDIVEDVTVSLTPGDAGTSVFCTIAVVLRSGEPLRATARGRHAYDAINRAAYRISDEVAHRSSAASPV